ncbi:MAG: hypothetical protein WAU88_05800 [Candidatus Zixiibacteriota bacterium]
MGTWKVDTVGTLAGHTVVDICLIFKMPTSEDVVDSFLSVRIKAIGIETSPNLYRLTYLSYSDWGDIFYKPSHIVTVDSLQALFTDSPMSGSGGFHDIDWWIWDNKRSVPLAIGSKSHPFGSSNERLNTRILDATYGRKSEGGSLQNESWRGVLAHNQWPFFHTIERKYDIPLLDRTQDSLTNQYARVTISSHYPTTPNGHFESLVDTIGILHGLPFVEISYWFHCPACRDTIGKFVAVETKPKRFKPIYFGLSTPVGSGVGQNAVLVFGDDTVIAAKGCQNYVGTYSDNYWVWPKESPAPVPVFQEWVLSETLTRIAPKYLPLGLTARIHKGKWNFERLSYETYTWKKDDPDNAPSGGKLFIQFGLKNHRLQPLDITYDSTALAPSAN